MPTKKLKEENLTVRQGNTNKNCYWIEYKAYQLLPNNELVFSAGGICDDSETELVKSFIKRNKKVYHYHTITVQIEYNEKLNFGKYINKTVDEVKILDLQYLKWVNSSFDFSSAQEKLKKEITEILK
jgi:hypothetical protein